MNCATKGRQCATRKHFRPTAGLALMAAAIPGTLHAQTAAPPTREELGIGSGSRKPREEPSKLVVEGDIERGPCPLAAPSFAATKVTFSRVTFNHLTAVAPDVLDSAWRDMAGRELPVASLCEVRDRAATMLREMGFLAAVQIPPQRIEKNGEVRMDVLVAKLVEVQVRGNPGHAGRLIAAHLAKLTKRPWFNVKEAERQLLLLSDLPGFDIRLTLRSAKGAPGEVVGDVLVRRRPVDLSVGTQNLGSKATGREGVFAQFALNDVTGLGDRTVFSVYNTLQTREQTVLQLAHDFALGSDGLRLSGSIVYGRGHPEVSTGNFKTETVVGRIELTYPLIRRQTLSLNAAAGIDIVDQSVDLGSIRLSKDKLRVPYARLNLEMIDRNSLVGRGGYSSVEPKWRASATLEARQGIAGLGASKDCNPISNCAAPNVPISNLLADPSAFVLRAEGALEYRPIPAFTLAVSPRLQYSSSALLSFEQYSVGNYTIGRGFDPGALLGDSGAGSSFELRVGRLMPRTPNSIALQPFAFFDAAWTWTNDSGLTNNAHSLYSAGGGLRARWGNHFDANLLLAAPLKRTPFQTGRGDVRVLFTIRARLLPWKPS